MSRGNGDDDYPVGPSITHTRRRYNTRRDRATGLYRSDSPVRHGGSGGGDDDNGGGGNDDDDDDDTRGILCTLTRGAASKQSPQQAPSPSHAVCERTRPTPKTSRHDCATPSRRRRRTSPPARFTSARYAARPHENVRKAGDRRRYEERARTGGREEAETEEGTSHERERKRARVRGEEEVRRRTRDRKG